MEDIEAFSVAYRARLDEAQLNKSIPDNISLEVSVSQLFSFFSVNLGGGDSTLQRRNLKFNLWV